MLSEVFDLRHVNSWGYFGILIAYVLFFRFNQYFLFAMQTGTLFAAKNDESDDNIAELKPSGNYAPIKESAIEMPTLAFNSDVSEYYNDFSTLISTFGL